MLASILSLALLFVSFCCVQPTVAKPHHETLTPLGVPWKGHPVTVSKKYYNTGSIAFVPNSNWLGMELDFQYAKPLLQVLNSTKAPLITRGESHITVITPPEFSTLATANVTIEEINAIALKLKIQKSKFKMICLGKESLIRDGKEYVVYQILVESGDLVKIREAIFRLYYAKGGNPALFDPRAFWPHITIGFTVSDLFEQDGVRKGLNACHSPIVVV